MEKFPIVIYSFLDIQPPPPSALWVDLPLDHFSPNSTTYKNRYYVEDSSYFPGGPVILVGLGNLGLNDTLIPLINDVEASPTGPFATLAMNLNGHEHRYYGKSYPRKWPKNNDPSELGDALGEYYKYLTVEQALEDIVVFSKNFTYGYPGQSDQALSSATSDINPSTPGRNFTTVIPAAGAVPPMDDSDENIDIAMARKLFSNALTSWLPAYTPLSPLPTSAVAATTGSSNMTVVATSPSAILNSAAASAPITFSTVTTTVSAPGTSITPSY
ncbi:hypothetical protein G7Y89_g14888 [Cudoniella acicularis]|uniref:Uncharacterized protein n=1 Tax=Cudoniella acicularis TaxID=354080 RepID=A0A8H4QX06_9HELO|nr:hypothetical protein G7Y89_g14888 [Cudoniella acicularis]